MQVKITLKKSLIGRRDNQVKTANALGLFKINQVVIHEVNESINGMIKTINHLILVEKV